MSALLMTSLLSGCGGGQADAEKTQEAAQTQAQGESQSQSEAGETAAVNPDATEVLFWISLSGGMGETIEEIVNNYNASQDKVHVTVEFQGNYYDMAGQAADSSYLRRDAPCSAAGNGPYKNVCRLWRSSGYDRTGSGGRAGYQYVF